MAENRFKTFQTQRNIDENKKLEIAKGKTEETPSVKKNKKDKSVSAAYQFYVPVELDDVVRKFCFENRDTKTNVCIEGIKMYLASKGYM